MLNDKPESVKKRNRQRSIAISYDLIREIQKVTKDYISVSSFIRMAVIEKLEKVRDRGLF